MDVIRFQIWPQISLLSAGLLFWGCAQQSPSGEGSGGPVVLTYWPAPNPQEIQLADSLVRQWNLENPTIHVVMQPIPVSQSTEEVLLAAIAGKTTPDVCSNIWPGALHDYTQAGGLVPLDAFPEFDSLMRARTPEDLLSTFRASDGHYYEIPWKSNPVMMYYNKRLLREAGVTEVPATYGQYLAAGEKVQRHARETGIEVWIGERDVRPIWWQKFFDFISFYIAASGGRTLFDHGEPDFDNPVSAGVFAFFRECYAHRYFPRTFFQGGDPFILEKKATHFSGPWASASIHKFAPQIDFDVAPLPVPDGYKGPVYTYGDYKNISIFSTTTHPREAWAFAKFLVSAQHDLLLLKLTNQIPVRGDLLTNPIFAEYFRENHVIARFAEQALYTRGIDDAPDLKEILDAIAQEYEACAVYSRISPEEASRDAVRRTRLIVEWNK